MDTPKRSIWVIVCLVSSGVVVIALALYWLMPPPVVGPDIRVVMGFWVHETDKNRRLLFLAEVDLERARYRKLTEHSRPAQPLSAAERRSAIERLRAQPWGMIAKDKRAALQASAEKWIEDGPPKTVSEPCPPGREKDGGAFLIASTPKGKHVTEFVYVPDKNWRPRCGNLVMHEYLHDPRRKLFRLVMQASP